MRASLLLTCCWPGLTRLWRYGQWRGFVAAGLFTVLINLALAVSFLELEGVGTTRRAMIWTSVGVFWLAGFWLSRREQIRNSRQRGTPSPDRAEESNGVDLYPVAQIEYLKGNWFEAERLLGQAIQSRPEDVDAHLMLAALYRHTERFEEGGQQLNHLANLPGAAKWQLEIYRERELLERLQEERLPDESSGADPAPQAA